MSARKRRDGQIKLPSPEVLALMDPDFTMDDFHAALRKVVKRVDSSPKPRKGRDK